MHRPVAGASPTATATASGSATPTAIASGAATATPTPTPKPSASATPTAVPTATPTATATPTPSVTGTPTQTGLYVEAAYPNSFVSMQTTVTVPASPPPEGTLIIWPGLTPLDTNSNPTYDPIDDGILRPVLTWGPSCLPGTQPTPYSTWYIAGEYHNTIGTDPGFTGCQGGAIMSVNVGDQLLETLTLGGTTWTERITDENTLRSVTFVIDMEGQTQNLLYFYIDGYGQEPVGAVTFSNTQFTMASAFPSAAACTPLTNGTFDPNDTSTAPTLSGDGLTCSIATITIYSPTGPISSLRGRLGPHVVPAFLNPPIPSSHR